MGGAVEKVWCALGKEFARRGHVVTHVSRCYHNLPSRETAEGVSYLRVPGFDARKSLIILKTLDLVYSLRVLRQLPKAEVLVTNTFWLPIISRDTSRGETYIHVARFPKGQMRLYGRAARLQTVSHAVAEAIRHEAPRLTAKVRVIPYPLIDGVPRPTDCEATACARKRQILFVGRIHPEKGVHLLIAAMAALPSQIRNEWRLVIVGPVEPRFGGGGDRYHNQLLNLARPIANSIDWRGPVFEPAALADIYRNAAIFVYPSLADRGETFGLAPLEGMAQGCVPLVSDLSCFREYVDGDKTGLYFNHRASDPIAELANRLSELLQNGERRSLMSVAAVERAKDFDLERVAEMYLDDFRSIHASETVQAVSFRSLRPG